MDAALVQMLGSPRGVFNYSTVGLLHVDDAWGMGHRDGLRAAAKAARAAGEAALNIVPASFEEGPSLSVVRGSVRDTMV